MGILFCAFFLFCFACYSDPSGALARVFSWSPLRWLGNMSYSFYLVHGVTIKASVLVLNKLLPSASHQFDWIFWCMLPVLLLACLLTSTVLFLTVERPFSLASAHRTRQHANDMAVSLP